MKKEELEIHVSEMDKTQMYDFALEYFGIKLDTRRKPEVVLETFYKRVAKKDPLKALPNKGPVVRDPFAHIDADEVEEITIEEENDAKTEEVEDGAAETEKRLQPSDNSGTDTLSDDSEGMVETPVAVTPSYTLNMTNGVEKYAQVYFLVTDALDVLKAGDRRINELVLPTNILNHVLTSVQYARQLGKVTLRETRNSRFITYTAEDFKNA